MSDARIPKLTDGLSNVPLRLELMFENQVVGVGTGFFYEHDGNCFFITNWHNATGRRPDTLACISLTAALPTKIRTKMLQKRKAGAEGPDLFQWHTIDLPLYEDEERNFPVWLEHPGHGRAVDVVAIPVPPLPENGPCAANATTLSLDKIRLRPGLDVFALGYPKGLTGGAQFPLWKRGTISTEPDMDHDGLPKLLIDSATRDGMSGSPVYAQEVGYWLPEDKTQPDEHVIGIGRRFIGVYSGRITGEDELSAQLGIVWKERSITEIIAAGKRGISSFGLAP